MFCNQCGTQLSQGATFCNSCGAQQAAPAARASDTYASVAAGSQRGGPSIGDQSTSSIDFRRLGTGDIIASIATIVIFISLFLPWYSYGSGGVTLALTALGTGAGGWRILILILCILVVGYLFARTLLPRGARLALPHWQVLTVVTAINGILVLLAFLVKPGANLLSVSWDYGAYIGLIAAIVAIIGGVVRRNDPETIVSNISAPIAGQQPLASTPIMQPPSQYSQAAVPPTTLPPAAPSPQKPQVTPVASGHCTACGTAIVPGNRFCVGCGVVIA